MEELNNHPELKALYEALQARHGQAILNAALFKDELTVTVDASRLKPVIEFLKSEGGMNALNDMIGIDNLNPNPAPASAPDASAPASAAAPAGKRFTILYQLYRHQKPLRIRVRIDLDEGRQPDSIVFLYWSANWAEREIFDMFGIIFAGHPDLRRIYMDDDFADYPLRKDFPLAGRAS